MKTKIFASLFIIVLLAAGCAPATSVTQSASATLETVSTAAPASTATVAAVTGLGYPIVDTAQSRCYDNNAEIPCSNTNFTGQDTQYTGNAPRYQDNNDGTVTDLVTGLMWQQDPGAKMTYSQAMAGASTFNLAGYTDWRLPTIKELYSLILFDGTDVSACPSGSTCEVTPFIDTRYFKFQYGDTSAGERVIDSQFATNTKYVSTTMNGDETMFGVNFADGRIKGYGLSLHGQEKTFFVLYVRGNLSYGQNGFADNGNGTISDNATSLTWTQFDSGMGMNWEAALNYCEALDAGGDTDWHLPNVKELQSIVDYSRSPATSNSAAIDPVFNVSTVTDESGQVDYPFYWSSTTHADSSGHGGYAAYVSFGRALGYMNAWVDVHGAGAQRSDPKTGSASDYPQGHGPQGDAVRVDNYVRCVRGGTATFAANGTTSEPRQTMSIESTGVQQGQPGGMNGSGTGQPPQGQGGPGGTPPQEAVNACVGLTEAAACSFVTPNGTITGTCQLIQSQLACVPVTSP